MNLDKARRYLALTAILACVGACSPGGGSASSTDAVPASASATTPGAPTGSDAGVLPSPRTPRPTASSVETATKILARVAVGREPTHIALGAGAVWVTNGDSTVSRVEEVTGAVSDTTTLPGRPAGIAANEAGAWVAINTDASGAPGTLVVQLDPKHGGIVRQVTVAPAPRGVTFGAGSVWVASGVSDLVTRVDPSNGKVLATIDVAGGPAGLRVIDGQLWVASRAGTAITRIDPATNKVAETIEVKGPTVWLAGDADFIWVMSWQASTVYRVNADTKEVATLEAPALVYPGVTVLGGDPWVPSGGELVRLDPATGAVADTINLGRAVGDVEATAAGDLFVILPGSAELLRVRPDS